MNLGKGQVQEEKTLSSNYESKLVAKKEHLKKKLNVCLP
jgi:hypothetical protein